MDDGIKIFSDGGSRGNPGPAACAFIVEKEGKIIFSQSKYLGKETNNVAEYSGVILALNWLKTFSKKTEVNKVYYYLDSLLIVNQLNGLFKIKNENLKKYFNAIKETEKEIPSTIIYKHIYREKNKFADLLVNKTLDKISR